MEYQIRGKDYKKLGFRLIESKVMKKSKIDKYNNQKFTN